MTSTEKQVLAKFKADLTKRLRVSNIILFGSRARGDADALSDMDLIVILEEEADDLARDIVSDCAWEAGFDHGMVLVPIVFSARDWEADVVRHSLLGKAVVQEGLAL